MNHCKTSFYAINFHMFSLIGKLEIGQKVVKNQRLTPLLFGEIFWPKIFNVISPRNHSNQSKTSFNARNFHIFTWSRKLEIGQKVVKNQRLTPLLFGQIFPPKIFQLISPKNHSNHCKTTFNAINCKLISSKAQFFRLIVGSVFLVLRWLITNLSTSLRYSWISSEILPFLILTRRNYTFWAELLIPTNPLCAGNFL